MGSLITCQKGVGSDPGSCTPATCCINIPPVQTCDVYATELNCGAGLIASQTITCQKGYLNGYVNIYICICICIEADITVFLYHTTYYIYNIYVYRTCTSLFSLIPFNTTVDHIFSYIYIYLSFSLLGTMVHVLVPIVV